MEKYKNTKASSLIYKTRAVLSVALITAFAAVAGCLSSCNVRAEIVLTTDKIYLDVGEMRDITPYVNFVPFSTRDKTFTLTTDSDCVRIYGNSVMSVSEGTATVTVSASGSSAELTVECAYGASLDWNVFVDGKTVQTVVDEAEPISFYVSGVTADSDVYWYVNGEQTHVGKEFVFNPSDFGEFCVGVKIGGSVRNTEVLIYRPSDAHGVYSGELAQTNDRSPVVFSVEETVDTRNPTSSIVWSVNGEPVGYGENFVLVPVEPTSYSVALTVNGVARKISDKDEITVSAAGLRAPCGAIEIKEDKIFATWRDGEHVRGITVTSPDGSRRSVSAGDAVNFECFGAGYVDVTDFIDVCAQTPGKYVLRLIGEATGEEFEFTQYPAGAQPYMSEKIYVSDSFVSSADEAADALTELYVSGKAQGDLYLSRELDGAEALRALSERAELHRLRADISVSGDIASILLIDPVNEPARPYSEETVTSQYTTLPHIEYDESNRRGQSYVLAIDRQNSSATVTNTEQLLYCVTNGIRPVAQNNAKTVYDRARATLRNIIGKDYDDIEKVHAVYDWVQWATRRSYTDVEEASERFLEGAFAVGIARGVVTDEGAAKAVALLCGMEGIPSEVKCENGRYFAEVTVNGKKLDVDAFNGKNSTLDCEAISGNVINLPARDILSHAGLDTYFLQKHIYNNVYFDHYIDRSEFDDGDSIRAAVFYAFDRQSYGIVTVRDYATSQVTNTEYGTEFMLDPMMTQSEKAAVYGHILSAVREYTDKFGDYSDEEIKIENYDGIVRVHALIRQR